MSEHAKSFLRAAVLASGNTLALESGLVPAPLHAPADGDGLQSGEPSSQGEPNRSQDGVLSPSHFEEEVESDHQNERTLAVREAFVVAFLVTFVLIRALVL